VHAIELSIDDPDGGTERVELGGQRETGGAGADDQDAQLFIEVSQLSLGREVFSTLVLHALDPQTFAPGARQEPDTGGEAEPEDTRTHEKRRDPDHGFQPAPPPTRPT
jgi:hypothetical protein